MDEPSKPCCTCHRDLPLTQFNARHAARDGLQSRCRECSRAWYLENGAEHRVNVRRRNARVRVETRERLAEYLLTHPCVDCGESDVRCLDFDHRDPSAKKAGVGRLVNHSWAWKDVLLEIEKCDVRCANCHRKVTARQWGWWQQPVAEQQASRARSAAVARLARVLPSDPGTATR